MTTTEEPRKPDPLARQRMAMVTIADLQAEIAYREWFQEQCAATVLDSIRQPQCKGFVPSAGFGNQRKCASCGKQLEQHSVRVQ